MVKYTMWKTIQPRTLKSINERTMGVQPRNYRLSLQTSFTMTLQVDAKQAASKSQIFTNVVICNLLAIYWQMKPKCCDTALR